MLFQDFQNAVTRLKEVLVIPKSSITRDSAIKRFELCFDLAWKSIKNIAQKEGVECYSPRACLKTGFQLHLIEDEEGWLKIVDERNTSTHLYHEKTADEIFARLPSYVDLFEKLAAQISAR